MTATMVPCSSRSGVRLTTQRGIVAAEQAIETQSFAPHAGFEDLLEGTLFGAKSEIGDVPALFAQGLLFADLEKILGVTIDGEDASFTVEQEHALGCLVEEPAIGKGTFLRGHGYLPRSRKYNISYMQFLCSRRRPSVRQSKGIMGMVSTKARLRAMAE
jgi:hypothetical protein